MVVTTTKPNCVFRRFVIRRRDTARSKFGAKPHELQCGGRSLVKALRLLAAPMVKSLSDGGPRAVLLVVRLWAVGSWGLVMGPSIHSMGQAAGYESGELAYRMCVNFGCQVWGQQGDLARRAE
jgi:hypothetical protein